MKIWNIRKIFRSYGIKLVIGRSLRRHVKNRTEFYLLQSRRRNLTLPQNFDV